RCGLVRITLTAILGAFGALVAPDLLGLPATAGAAGITLAGGIAGWAEFVLLRRALCGRLGRVALPMQELFKLGGAATAAAVAAPVARLALLPHLGPLPLALAVVPAFGLTHLIFTGWLDIPESAVILDRLRRRKRQP